MSKKWILNPDYSFKNDRDRVCMYSKRVICNDSSINWISYIHPMQAVILGLFTNGKPFDELVFEIASKFRLSLDVVNSLISKYKNNPTPIYTEWQGVTIIFPKNVLIEVDDRYYQRVSYDFSLEDLTCQSTNLKQDRMHLAPHSILWMLNTACVTNCKYCYADRNTPYRPLSTSQILKIIEELHNLKVQYVDVIGGEIFLKKDWEVIIAKLVEYGMSPTYISTKMPITHNLAEKLKQTGYRNVVQLSIDSLCDETLHDIIGANKGYAEQMKESAVILQEYNFPIQIDTILTKHNANPKEIKFLYDFIKRIKGLTTWEIRVPEWSLYTPETFKNIQASKSSLQSILDHIKHEIISNAEINITLSSEALEENFRSDGPEKQCFKGGTCGILQNRCFVLPDGKVSVCEQMYWHKEFVIGDLTKQSMEEIWNSDKAIEIFDTTAGRFRKESRCSSCKFFDGCNRDKRRCVVKVVKAYGLANWDYPDPRCVYAPEIQTGLKY